MQIVQRLSLLLEFEASDSKSFEIDYYYLLYFAYWTRKDQRGSEIIANILASISGYKCIKHVIRVL